MRFTLYQILLFILTPIFVFITIQQSIKRNGGLSYIIKRLGFSQPKNQEYDLWIHCASVGEVKTALPLINETLKQKPHYKILVSTNTPSGKQVLTQDAPQVSHTYLPWDLSLIINSFVSKLGAKKLIIIETEIWPSLYKACHKNNIPIYIVNARLSDKTFKANSFIKHLYRDSLNYCEKILCQSKEDQNRYTSLCDNTNISYIGNLKFHLDENQEITALIPQLTQREYISLISTHHDEELQITNALLHSKLDKLIVIIPRHIERSDSIKSSLKKNGYKVSVRSQKDTIEEDTQIYLADTIGEVKGIIKDAEICIMGGSFIPHGGQNILEAASLKKAIVCGPFMHNFQEVHDELLSHEAIVLTELSQLYATIQKLNSDSHLRNMLGQKAYDSCLPYKNITRCYLKETG